MRGQSRWFDVPSQFQALKFVYLKSVLTFLCHAVTMADYWSHLVSVLDITATHN